MKHQFVLYCFRGITGVMEDEFENDENVKKATRFFVSTKRKGTWADSETELALKSLLSFSRGYTGK